MAKKTKLAIAPKLRFPAFQTTQSWMSHSLSQFISTLDAGVSVNAGDRSASNSEIGILKTSCVSNGVFNPSENKVVFDPQELRRVTEPVVGGTIIISRMNTIDRVGANAYVEHDAPNLCLPDRLWAAKGVPDANMRYLAQVLGSVHGRQGLSLLAAGSSGSMKNISKTAVLKLQIYAPEPPEQAKIADCLTSLDAVIAAQARKLEALSTNRRGLMQQLFPREGETVPRLRFPEFRDSEPWDIAMGSTLFSNRAERGTRDLPIYSVTMTDGLVYRSSLGRRVCDLADATENKKARKDDVVYNTMRMWQGACGVADKDCMLSPAYVVLAPKDGVHSAFFGYLFKLPHMLRSFTAHSRGLTEDRLRLYFDDFSGVPLVTPSRAEQKRIADCLASTEARIGDEAERLRVMRSHKRALMQQLFPSPIATGA